MEFRVCIDNPFLNCKKVHPYGQRKMRYILDNVDLSGVKFIIIFGSSVTSGCHVGSDIDLYFELEKGAKKPDLKTLPFVYDDWYDTNVDDRLKNEIFKKGVVVWKKEKHF